MYFNFSGDVAYTCETAGYFFLYQIQSRWEKFLSQVTGGGASTTTPIDDISKHFPFEKFFADAPQPIFKGKSYKEDMEIARGCWRYLSDIFQQLDEFRAFELLRTGKVFFRNFSFSIEFYFNFLIGLLSPLSFI